MAANGGSGRPAAVRASQPSVTGPELEALRLLVHRPDDMLGRLHAVFFEGDLAARAYQARAEAASLHDAVAGSDPEVADLLQRLAVDDADEDADEVVIRLIERSGARALAELERDARQSSRPQDYGAVIAWLKLALERLRGGQFDQDDMASLVAWLVSHADAG